MKLILLRPRLVRGEIRAAGDEVDLPTVRALRYIQSGKAVPAVDAAASEAFRTDLEKLTKDSLINLAGHLNIEVAGIKRKADILAEIAQAKPTAIKAALDKLKNKLTSSVPKKK